MNQNLENRIAIIRAIAELLKSRPLDEISVTDISGLAHISRATFYRHFPSKYDALRWVISIYSGVGIDEIGRTLSWHEGLECTTAGLSKHENMLFAVNRSNQPMELPKVFVYAKRRDTILATLREWRSVEVSEKLLFQAQAYARLSSIIASEWHSGLYSYSLEEYILYLESIVPRDLHDLMDGPAPLDCPAETHVVRATRSYNQLAKAMLDTRCV